MNASWYIYLQMYYRLSIQKPFKFMANILPETPNSYMYFLVFLSTKCSVYYNVYITFTIYVIFFIINKNVNSLNVLLWLCTVLFKECHSIHTGYSRVLQVNKLKKEHHSVTRLLPNKINYSVISCEQKEQRYHLFRNT